MVDEQVKPPFLPFGHASAMDIEPHARRDDDHHEEDEKEKSTERAQEGSDLSPQPAGQAIDDGEHAEQGVEYADTCEVRSRTEMADALPGRRIIDINRYAVDCDTMPGGKNQQFQFGLIAGGEQAIPPQLPQWIEAEACLCVGHAATCLHSEPEIGEAVGEVAAF